MEENKGLTKPESVVTEEKTKEEKTLSKYTILLSEAELSEEVRDLENDENLALFLKVEKGRRQYEKLLQYDEMLRGKE